MINVGMKIKNEINSKLKTKQEKRFLWLNKYVY